jgi:Polyketide cyclase / dehydrase and lipid transport
MTTLAQGTNRAFSHSVQTSATPEAIWTLWSDVTTWKTWDKGLKDAQMAGTFVVGSEGQIIPLSGPPARFKIIALEQGKSYSFATSLPGARLIVARSFVSTAPNATVFRHDVSFTGPLGWFWADRFGAGFRAALPPTMTALARLAEGGQP